MVISPDGAMVPLVGGQWAEVKTLAIGQVQEDETQEIGHSLNLSYFSRMTDAQTFADLATVETARRGIERAERVCAVMDGAQWLDGFVDLHRPDAVRILDFSHAAEYVSQIGTLAGLQEPEFSCWLSKQLHGLKHDGPTEVLKSLRDLCEEQASSEEMAKALAYLEKPDAVSPVSSTRLAHWLRNGRERQQGGDASTAQRGWHALGTSSCQSHARLTDGSL